MKSYDNYKNLYVQSQTCFLFCLQDLRAFSTGGKKISVLRQTLYKYWCAWTLSSLQGRGLNYCDAMQILEIISHCSFIVRKYNLIQEESGRTWVSWAKRTEFSEQRKWDGRKTCFGSSFILSETVVTSVVTTALLGIQWKLLLLWQSAVIKIFHPKSDVKWRIYSTLRLFGHCFRMIFLIIQNTFLIPLKVLLN